VFSKETDETENVKQSFEKEKNELLRFTHHILYRRIRGFYKRGAVTEWRSRTN
jgi:hypothetical protein